MILDGRGSYYKSIKDSENNTTYFISIYSKIRIKSIKKLLVIFYDSTKKISD